VPGADGTFATGNAFASGHANGCGRLRRWDADEPEVLGGTNTAANPVEQILGALGSCLSIGYTAGAVARGITIEHLRIDLTGTIDLRVSSA
jgi:uncharacterized OsmC-like protein